MRLTKAAQKVKESISETLTYMSFPSEHWTRIRTNNTLERLNKEIKRRTKVVGTFPDGYLNMEHLASMLISQEEELAS